MMRNFEAIKVETEAEGASWDRIRLLKHYADLLNLPVWLKVGGCEARTDIRLAQEMGIDGVIAPMVESAFSVKKFHEATHDKGFSWRGLTVESETACRQIEHILQACLDFGFPSVTIGRGDLADSLGFRGQEDSPVVRTEVLGIVEAAREAGLDVNLGGNMTVDAIEGFPEISELFSRIETRRVVIRSWGASTSSLHEALVFALQEEINLEEDFVTKAAEQVMVSKARIQTLSDRMKSRY